MNPSCAIFLHMDHQRHLLRHTVAALAYCAARAFEGSPVDFADFAGAGRTPAQILAHMGDLFDWALSIAEGAEKWHNAKPLPWPQEQERFFAVLQAFDARLASNAPLHASIERLFQGPVADAFSHVGQIAMMRRLAGSPIRGENYYVAQIEAGSVGASQAEAVQPF